MLRSMTNNGIGVRIKQVRESAQMKRVELAVKAGLAPNTIRNYEDGLTKPSDIDNLRRIADALDVEVMWLIDGDRVGEEVA